MKLKSSMEDHIDDAIDFEIKNPAWAFWTCLLAMVGCIVTFFVFLNLKAQNIITMNVFYIGFIFLALSLIAAVGIYVCIYEKLTYSKGVYKYNHPFAKNQIAKANDIAKVKILISRYHNKYGAIRSKIRIFFYDRNKNVLIKIIDDGTLSENEIFIKSLKHNRIKIIREEKYNY